MKKKRSLYRILALSFVMLIGFVAAILALLIYALTSSYRNQLQSYNKGTLELYVYDLTSQMDKLSSFCQSVYSDDYNFQLLSSPSARIDQQLSAQYELNRMLASTVPSAGALFIFNASDSLSFYQFGSAFTFDKSCLKLADFARDYWRSSENAFSGVWNICQDEDYSLILYHYQKNGLVIGAMIDLNKMIVGQSTSSTDLYPEYAFYTDDAVLTNEDFFQNAGLSPSALTRSGNSSDDQIFPGYITASSPILNLPLSLCSILQPAPFLSGSHPAVIPLFALFVLLIAFLIALYVFYKKSLLYPLNQIIRATSGLRSSHACRFETTSIEELDQISSALEDLVEQKIHLELSSLYQEHEKEHAMLQYYQLQTRSHFFINCLKSLYNMLENGKYDQMKLMIFSFSNHLRFIFHDTFSLVPLRAELDEITDYYSIISLDLETPVFIDRNIDESLLDCLVPPLLIQTFLENSYKHSRNSNKLLHFFIRIDSLMIEGRHQMRIMLRDNGRGYDPEILQSLNDKPDCSYTSFQVGIRNLKHRMQLIYHSDYEISFFNHSSGGACVLIYLPIQHS